MNSIAYYLLKCKENGLISCSNSLCNRTFDKTVQRHLPCRGSKGRLLMQFRRYADIETALICPFRFDTLGRARFQIIVHRVMEILNQVAGIFSLIGKQGADAHGLSKKYAVLL